MNNKETELRVKVQDFVQIKNALKALNLNPLGRFKIKDRFFDKLDDSFYKKGAMIRLRTMKDNGENKKYFLTYKEPAEKNSYKVLKEIEVEITEENKIVEILECLGFKTAFYMEKIREIYHLEEVEITLDRYPFLGNFVEIEGAPKNIEGAIMKLKMKRNNFNNRSLDYYINKTKKRLGLNFKMTFEEERKWLNSS